MLIRVFEVKVSCPISNWRIALPAAKAVERRVEAARRVAENFILMLVREEWRLSVVRFGLLIGRFDCDCVAVNDWNFVVSLGPFIHFHLTTYHL